MRVKWNEAGRCALVGAALATLALLASCGGGAASGSRFHATRVVAFGDESSLLVDTNGDANGSKYSVNATVSITDPTLVCGLNPIWVQQVATLYGLLFPQCNAGTSAVLSPTSRIRATLGAVAADLTTQIDAQQTENALGAGDIVTVLIGSNDIIAQYQQYPALSEPQLIANVEAAGTEAGRQVNRLTDTGAKVLLATIPDVGTTPFGLAEKAANVDTDRAALLSRLSTRYNATLRGTIVNDGRKIGLVLLDELISSLTKFPGLDGFTNTTEAVCDLTKSTLVPPSSLDCTALTFVNGGTTTYLWADDRHLAAGAQNLLGGQAAARALNNPF